MSSSSQEVQVVGGSIGCILLSDLQAAKYLGASRSHFRNMHRLGQCPQPVKLGRSTKWRKAELEDWAEAGLPPVHQWDWAKYRARRAKKEGAK